jgi:hypothetical protein
MAEEGTRSMPESRSALRLWASDAGEFLGLLVDWASLTRIGRLNATALLGAFGGALAWLADLMASGARETAGAWPLVGTLAITLYGMGYWHLAVALRAAVPRAAALIRVSGLFAVATGTAAHALLAPAIVLHLDTLDVLEAATANPLLDPLLVASAVGVLLASLTFSWSVLVSNAPYSPWVAAVPPAVLIAAAAALGWMIVPWRASSLLVAPHIGHLGFFTLSFVVLQWRNPERWD